MQVKNIVDEDFVNYKLPSMFISTCYCDWKCCVEQGLDISVCQNSEISKQPNIEIPIDEICRRYLSNPISKAIVFGGLEPFKQFNDILDFVLALRNRNCSDTVVIYTGYEIDEIANECSLLIKHTNNIIIKTGRFIPNQKPHFDDVLGVNLISDNQKGIVLC